MLQRGFVVLLRAVGKRYEPDPELPGGLLASTLRVRLVALLRGLIRFRAAVFIGPGVRVRGKRSIQLGRFSTVDRGCQIDGYAACGVRVGDRTKLGAGTIVSCTSHLSKLGVGVRIGSDCGIGENGYFGASGGVTIGDDVIMGQYVSFHSENHNFENPDRPIREQGVTSRGISIGDDVWVGAKATFLDGARVGSHCVVAAGAVVRGEFPDRCIIGGVPARVLQKIGAAEARRDGPGDAE